ITRHVVEAVAVGMEAADRRGALVALGAEIEHRKYAVPEVGLRLAVVIGLIAPGEGLAVEPAARGIFPFRFGWQRASGPARIGFGVLVRDLNDGMIHPVSNFAAWSFRMSPARSGHELPPLLDLVQVMDLAWRDEHERAGG